MKIKVLLFFSAVVLGMDTGWAQQGKITLFSEGGEKFVLLLNGEQVNQQPAQRVSHSPGAGYFKALINFEQEGLPDIGANVGIEGGMESVYVLKKNNRGAWVCRPFAQNPLAADAPQVETTSSATAPMETTYREEAPVAEPNAATSVTQRSSQSQPSRQTVRVSVPGMQVSVDVDDPNANMDMDMDMEMTSEATYTETYTETTSSPTAAAQPAQEATPCATSTADFNRALESIKSKSFEDSKLTQARQIMKAKCLSTDQVIAIMNAMTYEESKLEVAKLGYDNVTDSENYYLVNDAFTYSSSIDELDEYMNR